MIKTFTARTPNFGRTKLSLMGLCDAKLLAERKVKNMKFINVGFGNMVAAERVVALANPDSAPIKRLIQDSKDDGRAIDVTCGRRTRAVIITDSEHVILSAIQTETIANRLDCSEEDDDTDEDEEEDEG